MSSVDLARTNSRRNNGKFCKCNDDFPAIAGVIWLIGAWRHPKIEHITMMSDQAQEDFNASWRANENHRWKYFRFAWISTGIGFIMFLLFAITSS